MTSFLLVIQIILVVLLTIAVLLQKSSSIGLGAYSGSNESVFGAKGPGSFLAKITFFLGFLFVSNTIALGYYYGQVRSHSVVDDVERPVTQPAPIVPESTTIVPETVPAPPMIPTTNAVNTPQENVPPLLPGQSTLTQDAPTVDLDIAAPLPTISSDTTAPSTTETSTESVYLFSDEPQDESNQ